MTSDNLPDLDGDDPLARMAAFVSARLVDDDDATVGAVSFDPDHHGDELGDGRTVTGWEIFVGDETEEELRDPECVRLPSLSWLVARYPELDPIFEHHDGSLASWVDEGGQLVPWDGDEE